MIPFVQLIFELVNQVLINAIKGISFIFSLKNNTKKNTNKWGAIMNTGPGSFFFFAVVRHCYEY